MSAGPRTAGRFPGGDRKTQETAKTTSPVCFAEGCRVVPRPGKEAEGIRPKASMSFSTPPSANRSCRIRSSRKTPELHFIFKGLPHTAESPGQTARSFKSLPPCPAGTPHLPDSSRAALGLPLGHPPGAAPPYLGHHSGPDPGQQEISPCFHAARATRARPEVDHRLLQTRVFDAGYTAASSTPAQQGICQLG